MFVGDKQLGIPARAYVGTEAEIEGLSLGGDDEGRYAYATDTDQWGVFDGSSWKWTSGDHLVSTSTTDDKVTGVTVEVECSGTVVDGFGVAVDLKAETDGGTDVAGKLSATWVDVTHASRRSRIGLWGNVGGTETLLGVIVTPPFSMIDGNARGEGAVDLQTSRSNAAYVASGDNSVLCGGVDSKATGIAAGVFAGHTNEASGDYAVIVGGRQSVASADYSAATGYAALADKYGQKAHAAGEFSNAGDAQSGLMVCRREIASHTDITWYDLYLDGSSERMTITADTLWTFDILMSGVTSGAGERWSYRIEGAVVNDGGTITLLNSTVTTISESDASYEVQVVADDTNDALSVQVRRNGGTDYDIRWVAVVRTCEVTYA